MQVQGEPDSPKPQWPLGIVLLPPVFRNSLCFLPVPEALSVQALIRELINETLALAILPRAARLSYCVADTQTTINSLENSSWLR